jgi:eukaryotic-like serine/threonine-protein kinase
MVAMSPTPSPARVVLEVVEGPHLGQRIVLDGHDTVLVGRGSQARLRLVNDPHFSRHHFLVEVNPPRALLRDLGSRNGTLINGRRVQQCTLSPGDVISGGQTRIRFTAVDAADALTTTNLPARAADERTHFGPPVPALEGAPAPAVPGYEVLRKLGQGGMGAVYLARHQATGDSVALKVIIPEAAARDSAVNRFLREARLLSQLDHPRIVRFREVGLHLGQFFLAMEYVEALDLKALLAGMEPPRRVAACAAVLCQALEGLENAHARGVVHRDVKPGNLLVGGWGGDLQTKVADFGLARNYQNAGLSGMTHEGQGLGTLPFTAPEQIVSARTALPAVDVYAAGAYPYDFSCADPVRVVLESPPVPLAARCPWVPAALAEVVHRALAKEPAQRFAGADAMRQALLPFGQAPPAGR